MKLWGVYFLLALLLFAQLADMCVTVIQYENLNEVLSNINTSIVNLTKAIGG